MIALDIDMAYDGAGWVFAAQKSVLGRDWLVPQYYAHLPDSGPFPVSGMTDVPELVATVIANREIEEVEEYLKPSFRGSMPDPYHLKGMKEAIHRVEQAINNKESIAYYGDYDVDGATSTSIMLRHFRMLTGNEATFYVPDRMTEGYGPNSGAMETLAERGINLLVILDSGTTAFDPIQRAVELGMDVIVIDHHKSEARLPEAIVVNPKRQDEDGKFDYLCTAGLAFLFCVGLQRKLRESGFFNGRTEPDLRRLLGIVALGTVADMVPLVGLNRAFVKIGLPMMDLIPGIRSLRDFNELESNPYTVYSCGFVYGPCINAGGRIGDTMNGTRLLATDDAEEAEQIAKQLYDLNQERRRMQQSMIDQALERITREEREQGMVVVYDELWHPGIVGLVASRIKEALDVSAVVIGTGGKGSARAADGFDIGQAIIDARLAGLLIAGGGHAAAGGLTINPEKLDEFRAFMAKQAEGLEKPAAKVDLIVRCGELNVQQVESLSLMEPFGLGNPSPRIAITEGILDKTTLLKGRHLKGTLKSRSGRTDFILFNATDSLLGKKLIASEGSRVDLYGKAKINEFGGRKSVQIHPEDAMVGETTLVME